jgi:hypothetical protein
MRTLFVKFETGYCGSEGTCLMEFQDDSSDEEIDEEVYYAAVDHAASYGFELCSDDCEDEDCEMDHPGSSNICGSWVDYDPKLHDRHLVRN